MECLCGGVGKYNLLSIIRYNDIYIHTSICMFIVGRGSYGSIISSWNAIYNTNIKRTLEDFELW